MQTVYNAAKQKIADVDPLGFRTSCGYDPYGRPEHVQNARGYVRTSIYNARDLIATENALWYRSTMSYDALGRQVAVQTPLGYRSTTIYDAAGQVAAQQDALGYFTSFGYDANGNRVTMMNALGFISTWQYFTNSNLLQAAIDPDPGPLVQAYSYDAARTAHEPCRSRRGRSDVRL